MTKIDFAKFIFGRIDIDSKRIECYYRDWVASGYDIVLFKKLLTTRG